MARLREFIQENFLIDHPETGEFVPFIFRRVQNKYYEQLCQDYDEETNFSGAREYDLKARKEGFTSMILGLFTAVEILSPHAVRALEISYKGDASAQHYRRCKNFCLSWMCRDPKKWSKQLEAQIFDSKNEGQEYVLKHNKASYFVGTASTKTGERGGTVQMILFTEFAHYPNTEVIKAAEIIEGTKAMVAVGTGMIFKETTANGFNFAKKNWDMAKRGEIDEKARFFGWREFYTEEEFKTITRGFMDKSKIPQEYPETDIEAFISTGRHVFNTKKLVAMYDRCEPPLWKGELVDDGATVQFQESATGKLSIWKKQKPGRKYLISADVAKGVPGGAWSVGTVFDRSSWEVVAEYRARLDPGEFGKVLLTMAYFWENALLIPENNSIGQGTIQVLKESQYPHVITKGDLWPEQEGKSEMGFPTNERTKGLLLTALRNAIDNDTYYENSQIAVEEMLSCVFDEHGKMVAEGSDNGGTVDTVITRGIGLYALHFYTHDHTYRESSEDARPFVVQSIAGRSGRERIRARARAARL